MIPSKLSQILIFQIAISGILCTPVGKLQSAARQILSSMNSSVPPCDDFYQHSCGNFQRVTSLGVDPESRFSILQTEVFDTLRGILENTNPAKVPRAVQQAIIAYKSCCNINHNNEDLKKLRLLLKKIGGWPMIDYCFNEDSYNLLLGSAIAIKTAEISPLVYFSVQTDDRNTSRRIINVDVPEILETRVSEERGARILRIAASKLGGDHSTFEEDLKEIQTLEKIIISLIAKTKREPGEEDNTVYKIKDLLDLIPHIDLVKFFQSLTNDTLNPMNEYLTIEDEILVVNEYYLLEILELMKNITGRTLANYNSATLILKYPMLAGFVIPFIYKSEIIRYTSSSINDMSFNCFMNIAEDFNFAIDYLYIKNTKLNWMDEKGREMVKFIREAFLTLANEANWIDNETLFYIEEKLNAMSELIGYPTWMLNETLLDEYYRLLPDLTENFATNLMNIIEFSIKKELSYLRIIEDVSDWPNDKGLSTVHVNAFYFPQRNSIYLSSALLNAPIYDPDLPWYLNFATVGSIVGHEITHGFDEAGSHRDKRGNLKNWWSVKSKEEFLKRSDCFVKQFDLYCVPEVNMNVNGELTLAENIADSGGLRQSFLAYQNWEKKYGKEKSLPGLEEFSPHKLFFMAYANMWCADYLRKVNIIELLEKDVHSPNPFRVIGSLSNFKTFSDIYKCPVGSKMNPQEKCIIW